MTELDRKVSDQLVRLVQIIFGFVLAQSLGRYSDVVLDPFTAENWLPAFALVAVFVTTVLSWIDWHVTMGLSPYNFNEKLGRRRHEQARLFSDLFIVSVYAYLLLAIVELQGPTPSVTAFMFGFVLIFLGYLISGLLRMISYGRNASKPAPILIFLGLYGGAWLGVRYLQDRDSLTEHRLAGVGVVVCLVLMVAYRITRQRLRTRDRARRESGLTVGIDMDGVLANQIVGVIPRIRRRLGMEIEYQDVTHWALPLGDTTDIAKEITSAMEDPDYILGMPPHNGARETVMKLRKDNRVRVLTARPATAEQWTQAWLDRHHIQVDGVLSMKEKGKSLAATDILVDDYIGNVLEYLTSTNGFAVLVDQPWNQDREDLAPFFADGRVQVIQGLSELLDIVDQQRQRMRVPVSS